MNDFLGARVHVEFNGHQSYGEFHGTLCALGGAQTPWALVRDDNGVLKHCHLARISDGSGLYTITFVREAVATKTYRCERPAA